MQRKFITNLLFLLLLNLLVKPFYIIGIDAEILERVGQETYGKYFALLNISFLLNIFLDLGITNYNTKNIAQHSQLLKKYLSGIITIRLALSLVYVALTIGIAVVLGYEVNDIRMLLILAGNQVLIAFVLYMRSNLAGLHLFRQDSIISVLDRLILIFICGILLWGGVTSTPFQIEWFVYAQSAAYAITLFTALALVLRQSRSIKIKFNLPFSVHILRQSIPYALLILLMTFYYRADSVMLERMLPDGSVHAGIYAQGYRLFEAGNMVSYLFAGLLLPLFSRLLQEKKQITELLNLSARILISGAITVGLTCFLFSTAIIELRYTSYITPASEAFSLLMLCFIAISTTYIYGTLLTANGNLKILNILAGAGLILNILLNLLLIPLYQSYGAAAASLITQVCVALAQILAVHNRFRLKINVNLFLKFSLYLLLVISVGWFLKSSYLSFPPASKAVIMFLSGIIISLLLGLINLKAIYKLLRYGED